MLITGSKSPFVADRSTTLYKNDGLGHFSKVSINPVLPGVALSSIAFTDVDSDSDQDVLVTGVKGNGEPIAKLYINDSQGNFALIQTPFEGVEYSSIAFADVDGDNYNDVLITGFNDDHIAISKLYINDGQGQFEEVHDTPFEGVGFSSIAFADVDGDNDQDVLITGAEDAYIQPSSRLYLNDGQGHFSFVLDTPFEHVWRSSIAFADVDGDNDQDVLITGRDIANVQHSKLYTNDGIGNFTEVLNTPFYDVDRSSIAFADVDGDNDQDVLITGSTNEYGTPTSRLYTNDGLGNFTLVEGTSFYDIYDGAVSFADVDGDDDQDVLVSGYNYYYETALYLNDGQGVFTNAQENFTPLAYGSVAFADIDGDDDQDVVISGIDFTYDELSILYLNQGGVCSVGATTKNASLVFNLYPNPASEIVIISYNANENAQVGIKIFDINGRLLIQQQVQLLKSQQSFPIDISSLHSGTYFIQMDDGKSNAIQKFIVH